MKIMKNAIIGLKDLRENMDSYISQINKGRTFVVVRKSKPVFRLAPCCQVSKQIRSKRTKNH